MLSYFCIISYFFFHDSATPIIYNILCVVSVRYVYETVCYCCVCCLGFGIALVAFVAVVVIVTLFVVVNIVVIVRVACNFAVLPLSGFGNCGVIHGHFEYG